MTWNFASINELLKDAAAYNYDVPKDIRFDFAAWKRKRDDAIRGLNASYERNWARENIELIHGTATFVGEKEIEVKPLDGSETVRYTAPHICIATGGYPLKPKDIKGAEHGITSDEFFEIEELPKKMAFVGAGYIAVELAGVMNALGVETHMFIRGERFLRNFDPMISETLTQRYEDAGVIIHKNQKNFREIIPIKAGKGSGKIVKAITDEGEEFEFNEFLWAVGRSPEIEKLNVRGTGIKLKDSGHIIVDEYQNTNIPGIYALGDVTGQAELTPGTLILGDWRDEC